MIIVYVSFDNSMLRPTVNCFPVNAEAVCHLLSVQHSSVAKPMVEDRGHPLFSQKMGVQVLAEVGNNRFRHGCDSNSSSSFLFVTEDWIYLPGVVDYLTAVHMISTRASGLINPLWTVTWAGKAPLKNSR